MAIKSIGIDVREAGENGAGKGVYCLQITNALMKLAGPDIEFFLYSDKALEEHGELKISDNAKFIQIPGKSLFWHWNMRKFLKNNPPDIYLAPSSTIVPAFAPKGQKCATVVHDLVSFLMPENNSFKANIIERLTLKRALERSDFVISVSKNTLKDLKAIFTDLESKHEKHFILACPAASVSENSETHDLDLPEKYILGIGTRQPRKNFESLLQAFADLSEKEPDLHLCIAGGSGWKEGKLDRIFKSLSEETKLKIHFLGYVQRKHLKELYSRAALFAFPSLYEGFGIPPLEAMSYSCPVVCSNTSSLPELVGDAALTFDPNNLEELKNSILSILHDVNLREKCIRLGHERARMFSWEASAQSILDTFKGKAHT